jgi:predicted MFS family arabinose efflux permease
MRPKGLWRDSEFLKLWFGQAVSQIGSRISREGLPLTADVLLDASPFEMGLLSGVTAAAVLLFGLFAGAWADRLRRRPILIVTDLGRALVLGTVPLAAVLHRLSMEHLYVVAAITGLLTVLFDVSYQAYLPALVSRENLVEGNSKLALSESVAEVAGPALTGILVKLITAPMAILFDAISFLCSAISVWLIRRPEPEPAINPHPQMAKEIVEGLRTTWTNPILRALAARAATAYFFGGFIGSLYILYAMRELKLDTAMLGAIISVGGASSLLGALITDPLVRRIGLGPTLIGAALTSCLASLMVPMAHGSVAMCAAFLLASQAGDASWPIYTINETSLRQTITPDHLLGRVNSAMHLMFRGILPLGALMGGIVAESIGVRNTMFAGSIGFLLSTLWLVFSPIRRLKDIQSLAAVTRIT